MAYFRAAVTYGLVRTTAVLYSTPNIKVYNHETNHYDRRPLLATEWLGGIAVGTCISASLAPVLALKDLHDLDLYANGRLTAERNKRRSPSSVMDIILRSLT